MLKILVTPTSISPKVPSPVLNLLSSFADELVFNELGRPLEPKEIISRLDGVTGYIAGLDYITAEVIEAAPPSLKVISRYGAGCDRVDLEAAAKKGIVVTNAPGTNAQAVADLAWGLMLSVARRIPALDRSIRQGKWVRSTGMELHGKTIGVVGMGAIGKNVIRRATGFSMKMLAYDPYADEQYMAQNDIRSVTLEQLLNDSDYISLHLPLNENTRHIIDTKAIAMMKQGAILINTSRGGLIDESAAYEALVSGRLGGLGLDAFEQEPPEETPLLALDNVVATPHTGAHTLEAKEAMGMMATQNLIDIISGGKSSYMVNF